MRQSVITFLKSRRSVLANNMGEPGPNDQELTDMLGIAARVPDHKRLVPWRFMLFQGEARARFGEVLTTALLQVEPDASEMRRETEFNRFLRVPTVVAVISSLSENRTVPEWEQILSAGAVCQNLLNAAGAFGYSAQWLTEWYTYDATVISALGLGENERIAGFVYIGSAKEAPKERQRPNLSDIISEWKP